jgi:trimethylamine:corrinoid methyltransferase-like protein
MQKLLTRVLSDELVREIDRASIEVLARTGVKVGDPVSRVMLGDRGCAVEGETVRMPEAVVRRALDLAPKSINIWDRDGGKTVVSTTNSAVTEMLAVAAPACYRPEPCMLS